MSEALHDKISDTEDILIIGAVVGALYLLYRGYENIKAGLSWFGDEIEAGASAVAAGVEAAATDVGQSQADQSQVLDPDTGESIQF